MRRFTCTRARAGHGVIVVTLGLLPGLLLSLLLSLILGACDRHTTTSPPLIATFNAELARTTHGVVHVRANDFRSLGYGLAYAYAQDNLCMFADTLLTVRGERARFFGPTAHATPRSGDQYGAASGFMDLANEDSDFFFKGYLDIEQLRAGYAAGAKEPRDLLEGYVAGYNRYLKDIDGNYPAACRHAQWVRPMTVDDMMLIIAEKALHASGQAFAREIVAGARDPGTAAASTAAARSRKPPRKLDPAFLVSRLERLTYLGFGSNGMAVGKELSSSGRGLLLGNPHYPWTSADRFYQAHLTVPGRYDAMGVVMGGVPVIVIGFNRDVAWSHTVTFATHFTTFRLALDPGDASGTTYLWDGERVRMSAKTVTVDRLMADGTLSRRSKTFYFSRQGAVIVKPEAGLAWTSNSAYVLADPNRGNTRMVEQWLGIGTATSVQSLKAALDKVVGLPWVNTIAADRDGNVLYADASVVPRMGADKFASECLLLAALVLFDGSRSACGWGQDGNAPPGIYAPANAPWTMRTDYVANSNDSYWLNNPHALLTGPAPLGYSPLYGAIGVEQRLRSRIGFIELDDVIRQRRILQLTDLQGLMFANRVYAAELVLPDLLAACTAGTTSPASMASPASATPAANTPGAGADAVLAQACAALSAWDRRANVDSRGAVLFREFWNVAATLPDKWALPFDPADPVHTPAGVAPAAMPALLAALRGAALKLQGFGIALDGPLGAAQGETRNGVRTPLHGGQGDQDGVYNSIRMSTGLTATGYNNVYWGASYIQAVTFDAAGPQAQGMLVYGQSVDPTSPYYADQIGIYARKEWPQLPFNQDRIRTDPDYRTMILAE